MTSEDKELLLRDLCGRLPYEVKIRIEGDYFYDEEEPYDAILKSEILGHLVADVYSVKSYLRPISNMTEKEKTEWHELTFGQRWITLDNVERCIDWLNAHHFDFRGLIERGLAIVAPEDMYKTE